MKAIGAIFAALCVPIMILNVFGGIVSGIWLAILGHWSPIFAGLLALVCSSMTLSLAMAPGMLVAVPAAKFGERRHFVAMYVFLFFGSAWIFAVITVWCTLVMWFFLQRATGVSNAVPLLIWSYGVATGPLCYMASKEQNEGSIFTIFFTSLAYIIAGCRVLFGDPTVLDVHLTIAAVMGVGMVVMFANAAMTMTANRNQLTPEFHAETLDRNT